MKAPAFLKLAGTAAALMALGLVACGNNQQAEPSSGEVSAEITEPEEQADEGYETEEVAQEEEVAPAPAPVQRQVSQPAEVVEEEYAPSDEGEAGEEGRRRGERRREREEANEALGRVGSSLVGGVSGQSGSSAPPPPPPPTEGSGRRERNVEEPAPVDNQPNQVRPRNRE